jgi:CBS domain-containing protein
MTNMARFVREIVNPEVFALRSDARSEDALDAILEFGITAVPVLDDERRPIGVTSLRDLVREGRASRIVSPAISVPMDASVEDAARVMAESGRHHLVVVGSDGRAVGMLSSLDLLRALIGLPAKAPATFPHYDAELDVSWIDATPLDVEHIGAAPEGPGVLVLSMGGSRRTECDLWVESPAALRTRLVAMLEIPQSDIPALARILERRDLRFRCATIADAARRDAVAMRLRDRIDSAPLPRNATPVDEAHDPPKGR